jgi:hypothetical protein
LENFPAEFFTEILKRVLNNSFKWENLPTGAYSGGGGSIRNCINGGGGRDEK